MSDVQLTSIIGRVARSLPAEVAQAVTETAVAVKERWRGGVAVDTGAYRDSIHTIGSGLDQAVEAGVDYDYAQEYGRPDLPNYTYTPAARPAAEAERQNHQRRVAQAIQRAAKR